MKVVNRALKETADVSRGQDTVRDKCLNVLGVVLVLGGLYLLLGWLGSFLGSRIPDAWERKLAAPLAVMQDAGDRPLRGHEILEKLKAGAGELRALEFELFSLEMEGPNAFAIPGGGIGLTSSLLEQVEGETGLAFILAHELGHHQHRHITKRMGRGLLLGLVSVMIFNQGGVDPVEMAMRVAESGYSREQEREADRFALELVHRCYGTTEGCLEFFERVAGEHKEMLGQQFLGSHPLTEERMKTLTALAAALESGEAGGQSD